MLALASQPGVHVLAVQVSPLPDQPTLQKQVSGATQVALASHAGLHWGVQVVPLPVYPVLHSQVSCAVQVACGSHAGLQVMSAQVVPLPS